MTSASLPAEKALDTRSDVHAVAEEVVSAHHHVSEVDAYAEPDLPSLR
jgi:hypothetical protein